MSCSRAHCLAGELSSLASCHRTPSGNCQARPLTSAQSSCQARRRSCLLLGQTDLDKITPGVGRQDAERQRRPDTLQTLPWSCKRAWALSATEVLLPTRRNWTGRYCPAEPEPSVVFMAAPDSKPPSTSAMASSTVAGPRRNGTSNRTNRRRKSKLGSLSSSAALLRLIASAR